MTASQPVISTWNIIRNNVTLLASLQRPLCFAVFSLIKNTGEETQVKEIRTLLTDAYKAYCYERMLITEEESDEYIVK